MEPATVAEPGVGREKPPSRPVSAGPPDTAPRGSRARDRRHWVHRVPRGDRSGHRGRGRRRWAPPGPGGDRSGFPAPHGRHWECRAPDRHPRVCRAPDTARSECRECGCPPHVARTEEGEHRCSKRRVPRAGRPGRSPPRRARAVLAPTGRRDGRRRRAGPSPPSPRARARPFCPPPREQRADVRRQDRSRPHLEPSRPVLCGP